MGGGRLRGPRGRAPLDCWRLSAAPRIVLRPLVHWFACLVLASRGVVPVARRRQELHELVLKPSLFFVVPRSLILQHQGMTALW